MEQVAPPLPATSPSAHDTSLGSDIGDHERLVGDLAAALAEAQAAEARTRQFLSDAAHHLRTPITGIWACAETLLRGCHPDERERLLAEIVRQASRASAVIAQLLTIARLGGGDDLVTEKHDVVDVCRQEVDRARSCAPWVEIALTYDDSTRTDVDGAASRRILATLLDNAIRHAMSRVDVAVVKGDRSVELRVVDNGPRLSAALGEQAFEPCAPLDGGGASGLGLSLARALARAQAGDLKFEDGAFVLRLPASA